MRHDGYTDRAPQHEKGAAMTKLAQAQSRFLGSVVERIITGTKGRCETVSGLRMCRCGKLKLYAKNGTQLGDVFVTDAHATTPSDGLVQHERHHRDAQWRRYGLVFGPMYLAMHVVDVWLKRLPYNRYELAAERASDYGGGYPRYDET